MDTPSDAREQRFESLFSSYYAPVLAYGLRRDTRQVAEDIASETFVVAWRRLEDVPADALPWLYAVARRNLANQRRGQARGLALTARIAAASSTDGVDQATDPPAGLERALQALSPNQLEALLLIAWEGLNPSQAAEAAGCSRAAFRLRLHRARQRIAASMASPEQPPKLTEAIAAATERPNA